MNKTITNLAGETERIAMPHPYWNGRVETGTGVWTTGLFYGPRTGRFFIRTYSIWDDGRHRGTCVGEAIAEISESGFLEACEQLDVKPPAALDSRATIID